MGHLLVLYTQVDQFIMEACAARIASAPDDTARLGLAKQVGDESRHVNIQKRWMQAFGVEAEAVISDQSLERLKQVFADLDWVDYLTDLYLVIEALGSQAVEEVVPLTDPGTRESLRIPLEDELDHVAFGLSQLREALAALPPAEREARLQAIPGRVETLVARLAELELPVLGWFADVGCDPQMLVSVLHRRRDALLESLAA
ncbi:MAG: hypothetical protein CMN57_02020 [Gammaproteobacteria bacterium]|nr:hypothetical protein [Gammaproteobacteria bacterium]